MRWWPATATTAAEAAATAAAEAAATAAAAALATAAVAITATTFASATVGHAATAARTSALGVQSACGMRHAFMHDGRHLCRLHAGPTMHQPGHSRRMRLELQHVPGMRRVHL